MDRLKACERQLAGVEAWLRQKRTIYRRTAVEGEYETMILAVRNVRDELRIECKERWNKQAESA